MEKSDHICPPNMDSQNADTELLSVLCRNPSDDDTRVAIATIRLGHLKH